MGAEQDRAFLERIADEYEREGDDVGAAELRRIAKEKKNPAIEIVEQTILSKGATTVPGSGSWSDIPAFKGYLGGVRFKPGNQKIEQRGHQLYLVQGDTSFDERQYSIYRDASTFGRPIPNEEGEIVWRPCQAVLVVFGFAGLREGLLWFKNGEQFGPEAITSGAELGAAIYDHLMWCVHNPLLPDRLHTLKKPPKPAKLF